jgi:glycosyltransferase involved in cell wall biosynthesis
VWLIHANPPEARIALFQHAYESWRNTYRIGYWVWESSVAPSHWIRPARWFHEIWTPSQSARDAFARAFEAAGQGAQAAKLRIVPHPVAVSAPATHETAKDIRALVVFDPRSDFDRKNPFGAVEAWLQAFPTPGAPRLIVKSLAEAEGHPRLDTLRRMTEGRDDIDIRAETLAPAQIGALIAGSDILISLHRAEGFGLPLAEAMANGVTVVATGWSGNMQFMTPDNAIPVPFRLVAANRQYNGPAAQWAEPDIAAAASALRRAATDADLRNRLGQQARADIGRLNAVWSRETLFPLEPKRRRAKSSTASE